MRALLILLAFSTSALLAQAQLYQAVSDPLTGEPVPVAFTEPPVQPPAAGGDQALALVAHLPRGATKPVRYSDDGWFVYQDGTTVVLAMIVHPLSGDPEFLVHDRLTLDGLPQDIFIAGERIYVAARGIGGLAIIEVTAEMSMELIGHDPDFDALAVSATGETVFVGAGAGGVRIYGIADPTSPQLLAMIPTEGSANGLHLEDDLLLVANGSADLLIIDVSTPAEPVLVGAYETNGFVTEVAVSNGVAYLTGKFGLLGVDVTDPAEPAPLDSFAADGQFTYDVAVRGDRLVLAGQAGLFHLDVSDPQAIQLIGSFLIEGDGLGVALDPTFPNDPFALLADLAEGLRLLMLPATGDPVEVAFHRNGGFANKLAFDGDHLYVTGYAGSLRIIDLSAMPAGEPVEIARLAMSRAAQSVLVEDGYAYVTVVGPNQLVVVDVNNPATPGIIGTWDTFYAAWGLDKDGDAIYLATSSGLIAVDVSEPQNPLGIGFFAADDVLFDVAVRDEVAFAVSYGGGMLAIDVSDPADMTLISSRADWPSLFAIDLPAPDPQTGWLDDIAFVGESQGLRAVDVGDPELLTTDYLVPTLNPIRDVARGHAFFGDYVDAVSYAADDYFGFRVFLHGGELTSFRSADRGLGVASRSGGPDWGAEGIAALAAGGAGVYIFRGPNYVSTEDDAPIDLLTLEPPFPNPADARVTIAFTIPNAREAALEVFDLLGRRISVLVSGPHAAGRHEASFDTSPLSSGVYVVRLSADGATETRKLTIVR